jgi:hypothetical protein
MQTFDTSSLFLSYFLHHSIFSISHHCAVEVYQEDTFLQNIMVCLFASICVTIQTLIDAIMLILHYIK